jgi:hypothetical protein
VTNPNDEKTQYEEQIHTTTLFWLTRRQAFLKLLYLAKSDADWANIMGHVQYDLWLFDKLGDSVERYIFEHCPVDILRETFINETFGIAMDTIRIVADSWNESNPGKPMRFTHLCFDALVCIAQRSGERGDEENVHWFIDQIRRLSVGLLPSKIYKKFNDFQYPALRRREPVS